MAHAHLRYLNPFPANLGEVLRRYPQVVAPEMNLGQLALVLRGKYLVDVQSVSKVQGVAFLADEIGRVIRAALGGRWPKSRTTRRWSPEWRRQRLGRAHDSRRRRRRAKR